MFFIFFAIEPSSQVNGNVTRRFWLNWTLILGIVFTIYLITMINAPIFHSDLFMNIDLGRIVLNPNTDWAITWLTKLDKPVFLFNYLGIVSQEYIFQITGLFGPIVFTIIGALIAATIMVKWLLIRNTPNHVAFILSFVFLLDPIFVQSYTVGRLDSWTIALCLSVCLLLRDSIRYLQVNKSLRRSRLVLAGGITAVSFFTWPSAIFLLPLILWELFYLSLEYKQICRGRKVPFLPIIIFGLGCLITVILLLIPVYELIYFQLNDILNILLINLQFGDINSEEAFYMGYFSSFIELFRALKYSPFIFLLAIVGFIKQKNSGIWIAFLISLSLMIFSVVYIHRVLYLLPYFIIGTSYLFRFKKDSTINRKDVLSPPIQTLALIILIIWSSGLSIGAYTILSIEKMSDHETGRLYKAAETMGVSENHRVLIPNEFYFIGRSMGWKMYMPYTPIGVEKFSFKEMEPLLPHLDYAIINESKVTEEFSKQLAEEGMSNCGDFYIYENRRLPFDGKTTNITRLRNLYKLFKQPYSPYTLFARETKKQYSVLAN